MLPLEHISVLNSLRNANHVSRRLTGYPALNQETVSEDTSQSTATTPTAWVMISLLICCDRDAIFASPSSDHVIFLMTF